MRGLTPHPKLDNGDSIWKTPLATCCSEYRLTIFSEILEKLRAVTRKRNTPA